MPPRVLEPIQNWNDLRAQLVWVYEGPPSRTPYHEYHALPITAWLLHRGQLTLKFKGGRERYGPGAWIFPRAEEGFQEFSPDAHLLSVRFLAEWPTGESLFPRTRSHTIPAARLPKLTRIGERLARLVGRQHPGTRHELPEKSGSLRLHFEMQRLLCGWMLSYADAMEGLGLVPSTIGTLDARIRRAVHLLESRPLSQRLRERDLAGEVGLSVSQFNKLFVGALGRTPAEYWEAKRIHTARLALLESRRSAKSIAYDLGFKSLPHFSFWVKARLGKSPRSLRGGGKKGN